MAKYKASAGALRSWEEVDEAMHRLVLAEIAERDVRASFERQVAAMKEQVKRELDELASRQKREAGDIEAFLKSHKAEFDEPRSRSLTWGRVGFRVSTAVKLARGVDYVVELEKRGLFNCVQTDKKAVRTAMAKLPLEVLQEMQAQLIVSDEPFIETDAERLAEGA